ncbi:flagellar hook protein FlgE [Megalodesulfovibrio paquesii]
MSTLTGAMYTGITGLSVHGQALSVVGDNLANSNTVGFKASTIQFEDLFYSSLNTANGPDQVGHGAVVSTIYNDFSQGSFETTTSVTDLAISGNGYFIVEDPISGETYYTRAGNFTFDDDGYLVTAAGLRVQGWAVDAEATTNTNVEIVGDLTDIQIGSVQSPPQATTLASLLVTLDKESTDKSTSTTDPYFALLQEWDGTQDPPIGENSYTYQTTMTVYDEAGTAHELTIYFDPVEDNTTSSTSDGGQVWEYIITCAPDEDGRTIDGQTLSETTSAGLLMSGTLSFDSAGELIGMTAFTLNSSSSGDLKDLTNWTPAEINDDGYPVFTANFSGADDANVTTDTDAVNIAFNFGMHDSTATTSWDTTITDASSIGTDKDNLFTFTSPVYDSNTTTAYSTDNATLSQSQNGYKAGYLSSIEIDSNGVLVGTFTNGQTMELYAIGLADFTNSQGLVAQGGNLYAASRESGDPAIGLANTSTMGAIASNTLEMSNVDYSGEMVDLIRFQRGYQANSKVITTVDSLLQEAINLKR